MHMMRYPSKDYFPTLNVYRDQPLTKIIIVMRETTIYGIHWTSPKKKKKKKKKKATIIDFNKNSNELHAIFGKRE